MQWRERAAKRKGETIGASESSPESTILLGHSDWGVRRNLGRPGQCWGARCLWGLLEKQSARALSSKPTKVDLEVLLAEDYDTEIEVHSKQIQKHLKTHIIHIGGGHDHAANLGKAMIDQGYTPIIINLDAHLDTRVDVIRHSGTPFRDLDALASKCRGSLLQIGIYDSANSASTTSKLENLDQEIMENADYAQITRWLKTQLKRWSKPYIFFSIDADAFHQSQMSAVSCPNGKGLELSDLYEIYEVVYGVAKNHHVPTAAGLYEYNPRFDDLALSCGRSLVQWMLNYLNKGATL